MPTVTATFTLGAGGTLPLTDPTYGGTWSATPGTSTVLTAPSTGGTSDGSGLTGCLQYTMSGKNQSSSSNFRWTGPWTDLGVPSSNVVSSIAVTYAWSVTVYTTGFSGTTGGVQVNHSRGTAQVSDLTTHAFSGTTAYATAGPVTLVIPSAIQAAATTVQIQLNAGLATGASVSAVETLLQDFIRVAVTYALPLVPPPLIGLPVAVVTAATR
jgi:hypothetical protein